jgi:transcription initiation factor TFIIIB Brf1 subunit/transcription initiation factor TFIIB
LEGKILKKMQGNTQQKVSAVGNILNEQKKCNAERLSSKKVLSYASKLWRDQSIAESIATEASHIITTVYKRRHIFFSGKSAKRVLSGIFYLLGMKNNAKKTQKQIANTLNTNDVTVRDSYRDWLDNFPDLFRQKHAD